MRRKNFARGEIGKIALEISKECTQYFKQHNYVDAKQIILEQYKFLKSADRVNRNFEARVVDGKFVFRELLKISKDFQQRLSTKNTRIEIGRAKKGLNRKKAKKVQKRIVNKNRYASPNMVKTRENQIAATNAYLKSISLKDKHGNSIPISTYEESFKKRFADVYMQMKELEARANKQQLRWLFFTLTVPPHMHANPMYGEDSHQNTSMKDAAKYLQKRFRAACRNLGRSGISLKNGDAFGFKVIEPHKSSTPHAHVLLFVKPNDIAPIVKNFIKAFDYKGEFLADNKTNAVTIYDKLLKIVKDLFSKNKCNLTSIKITLNRVKSGSGSSENIASASSYVAKYLMKGILGTDVVDELTEHSRDLKKIDAWRSSLQIRAFSVLGVKGHITKWREIKKTSLNQLWELYDSGENELLELCCLAKNIKFEYLWCIGNKPIYELKDGIVMTSSDEKPHESYGKFIELIVKMDVTQVKIRALNIYGENVTKISSLSINDNVLTKEKYTLVV